MIRCGRVHEGLMVDLVMSSQKLKTRGVNIVSRLAKVGEEAAKTALATAGGNIRLAVLCAKGLEPEEARQLLSACGGVLRDALREFNGNSSAQAGDE